MILLKDVCKSFDDGRSLAVNRISLEVSKGEILVLLGTSGCGKTTLLKMINRLIEPSAGSIEVKGQNILNQDPVTLRRNIGYVFQGIGLFPHLTIEENITIGLKLIGVSSTKRKARALELLEMVKLTQKLSKRLPEELSGGQQQRVGVARALAADPEVLLMDEPFGALDAVTRETLQDEILRLNNQLDKTIVFVTHDVIEAIALGNRIAILNDGKLIQLGTSHELFSDPQSPIVNDLIHKPMQRLLRLADSYQSDNT